MIYFSFYLLVLCVAIALFIYMHPVFGGNTSDEQAGVYNKFDNYAEGKFVFEVATKNGGAIDSSMTSLDSILECKLAINKIRSSGLKPMLLVLFTRLSFGHRILSGVLYPL